jgi:hypothetical protein
MVNGEYDCSLASAWLLNMLSLSGAGYKQKKQLITAYTNLNSKIENPNVNFSGSYRNNGQPEFYVEAIFHFDHTA